MEFLKSCSALVDLGGSSIRVSLVALTAPGAYTFRLATSTGVLVCEPPFSNLSQAQPLRRSHFLIFVPVHFLDPAKANVCLKTNLNLLQFAAASAHAASRRKSKASTLVRRHQPCHHHRGLLHPFLHCPRHQLAARMVQIGNVPRPPHPCLHAAIRLRFLQCRPQDSLPQRRHRNRNTTTMATAAASSAIVQ